MALRPLRVGLVDYNAAVRLQEALVRGVGQGRAPATLVLCEHPPVVTVGRAASGSDEPDAGALGRAGIAVCHVSRGGQATYHGPGQLVGYPILDLGQQSSRADQTTAAGRGPDLHAYVAGLEAALVSAVRRFGIDAQVVPGWRGLWVGDRKLASIGVAVRGRVAYHGFALNVCCDLAPFGMIVPCGLRDVRVTSMSAELGCAVGLDQAAQAVTETVTAWHAGWGGEPSRQDPSRGRGLAQPSVQAG